MGEQLNNLKSLFTDTRTRVIIIITAFLIILAIVAGFIGLRRTTATGPTASAVIPTEGSSITSIPGSLNPTQQYAKLQAKQNIDQAKRALKTGQSALPTVIQMQKIGAGQEVKHNTDLNQLQQSDTEKQLWFQDLKNSNCSPESIKAAEQQGAKPEDLLAAGCTAQQLQEAGVTAEQMHQAGISSQALQKANFSACDLKNAGYSAKQLHDAGFSNEELKGAGFSPEDIAEAAKGLPKGITAATLRNAGCSAAALTKERGEGVTATQIHQFVGCSADQLKAAGYAANDIKDAGFSAQELKRAGFSAAELKNAGFTAKQLSDANFTPAQLRDAGFTAKQLADAGLTPDQLEAAGFPPTEPTSIQTLGETTQPSSATASANQLNKILQQQAAQMGDQKLQQTIQETNASMLRQANQLMGLWNVTSVQHYEAGELAKPASLVSGNGTGNENGIKNLSNAESGQTPAMVKAGDIMFAVLDTSVNSDEPGPVLAHIVTGPFKGAKLIGSIERPDNAKRVILSFNVMSLPSYPNTIRINAVAIDQSTARTALSSHTDSHYLTRYGSLFASAFLEGAGDAIKNEGTRVETTATSTTFSTKDLKPGDIALVGTGKLGERWGQQLAPIFNRPPTVYVYSGTGLGILFTSDLASIAGVPVAGNTANGQQP